MSEDLENNSIVNSDSVSIGVLQDWLDITDRRIHQLVDEGVIIRLSRGEYDFEKSVRNYIDYLQNNLTNKPVSEKEKEERTKHQTAKRKMAELELAERQGKLVDKEAERKKAFNLARSLRINLQNIPARQSAILAGESDESVVYKILMDEIKAVLTGLQPVENKAGKNA